MRNAQDTDVLERQLPTERSQPLRLAILAAALVVAVDQLTKQWALNALEPGPCSRPDACIDLFAGIKFHLVFNTGAAFTRGSGYGPVLAVLALAMSAFLFYLASRRVDRLGAVLFGVIAGGAIGNLLDRIFRAEDGVLSGAVVDFIDLGWWPVFNIADSAIVVGVLAIIAMSFLERPRAEEADDPIDAIPADDVGPPGDDPQETSALTDDEPGE